MADHRHERGLIDTSVVIDLHVLDPGLLPTQLAVSALTFAELAAGVHAASDAVTRAVRIDRLTRLEAALEPLPFGVAEARAHGLVAAAVLGAGRRVTRARAVDLMIAATALAGRIPFFTRDGADFARLEGVVEVVVV